MNKEQKERYQLQAGIMKALAQPLRLAMLEYLKGGERCVCELCEHVGSGFANVSKHLSVMKNAGLVKSHQVGTNVYYSLTMPCALDFVGCVNKVLQRRRRNK